ncbi:MAG: adenylosuccinate lyase [Polaribacter sp.]|nr:adenylosuccinate lyase [Polaribacter sp.]
MSKDFLISTLQSMENPKRENRDKVANIVRNNKDLFKHLVSVTFMVDDKISIKAAWILEWICTHDNLNCMLPHLDEFTKNISRVHFDSATRPCAKICEHLAHAYTSKKENKFQKALTTKHIDTIIETVFDWLITLQKIAVRGYTMNALYLFGLQKDWVHPELEYLISSKIIKESKGCKARGTFILALIKKHQKI